MANPITLQCWVQGNSPDHIFPVKIDQTETMGSLKKAIKDEKQPKFDHITADKLDLWNFSISLNGSLNKSLNNLELAEGGSLLGWEELLDFFPVGVPKRHVHIIVKSLAGECALLSAPVKFSNPALW